MTRAPFHLASCTESFGALASEARELAMSVRPDDALVSWIRHVLKVTRDYRGVVASMAAAIADPDSALHASCVAMKAAGARLLARAQEERMARNDMDGADLFALIGALAWVGDQPSLAPRAEHLFDLVASAILMDQANSSVRRDERPPVGR
ncbi:TetR family transcriptional regulator [Roseomonas sp. ACRSG]|nr:TetR family transcriptional regulator [Roseomonas sp. ACRSG]